MVHIKKIFLEKENPWCKLVGRGSSNRKGSLKAGCPCQVNTVAALNISSLSGCPPGPLGGRAVKPKTPGRADSKQRSRPSSLSDSFEVWRQKRLLLFLKTIPLLQPGPYHLNKPGIPLPSKLLWTSIYLPTYPSIHLHTHPHIQPSKYLWKRSVYQALRSALEIQQWTDRSRIHSQRAYILLGKGEH